MLSQVPLWVYLSYHDRGKKRRSCSVALVCMALQIRGQLGANDIDVLEQVGVIGGLTYSGEVILCSSLFKPCPYSLPNKWNSEKCIDAEQICWIRGKCLFAKPILTLFGLKREECYQTLNTYTEEEDMSFTFAFSQDSCQMYRGGCEQLYSGCRDCFILNPECLTKVLQMKEDEGECYNLGSAICRDLLFRLNPKYHGQLY